MFTKRSRQRIAMRRKHYSSILIQLLTRILFCLIYYLVRTTHRRPLPLFQKLLPQWRSPHRTSNSAKIKSSSLIASFQLNSHYSSIASVFSAEIFAPSPKRHAFFIVLSRLHSNRYHFGEMSRTICISSCFSLTSLAFLSSASAPCLYL